jgi:hypothetical protein
MAAPVTLRPVRPDRLRWLAPPAALHATFAEVRAQIETAVAQGKGDEVYTVRQRSVYRSDIPGLGAVAIKELRSGSLTRQLWFRWIAEPKGAREYRAGVAFELRGGRTPTSFGAALECNAIGLPRVLLFTRWLEGAVTLTRWLAAQPGPPQPRLHAKLAAQVVAAARLGLVHRRHSSNNLLVLEERGEPVLYTIDFAHATLESGLSLPGLACDAARIARWLLHEKIWTRENAQGFFDAVVAEVRKETPAGEDFAARLSRELEAVTQNPSARRELGA